MTPIGTVTFLAASVATEGSARLLEEAVTSRHGMMVATPGNPAEPSCAEAAVNPARTALVAAFGSACDAVHAAAAMRRDFATRGRDAVAPSLALHTGDTTRLDTEPGESAMVRAVRLATAAHPGQVVLSAATAELSTDRLPDGTWVRDLGLHRFTDLLRPQRVWQLCQAGLEDRFPPLRSLDARPQNLPVQTTRFIGRREELRRLLRLPEEGRLLTLTGSPGVGKTRLALQAAGELLDRFPGGVWWADLARVGDGDTVPSAVLEAMAGREHAGTVAVDQIVAVLVDTGPTLVVLDNCEHLIDACARLVEQLLAAAPELTVLATSREPLSLPGEITWLVPSLPVPSEALAQTAAAVSGFDAVRLFLDRARRARPQLTLTDDPTAAAVARICRRLDGIPLAIELAAVRCRSRSPRQIADELDDRFRVLTGGARTVLARQRTLQASIDWSHDLLSEGERLVFRRLSAFPADFDLDAAEAVCSALGGVDAWEVLDLLSRLVDKCLVIAGDGPAPRFRLLESVRQYALDRCADAGELPLVRAAHADWFCAWGRAHGDEWVTAPTADALRAVDAVYTDLCAALQWTAAQDASAAVDLLGVLTHTWVDRSRFGDARRLGDLVLVGLGAERGRRWAKAVAHLCMPRMLAGDKAFDKQTAAALDVARAEGWDDVAGCCGYALHSLRPATPSFDEAADALERGNVSWHPMGRIGQAIDAAGAGDFERADALLDRIRSTANFPLAQSAATRVRAIMAFTSGDLDRAATQARASLSVDGVEEATSRLRAVLVLSAVGLARADRSTTEEAFRTAGRFTRVSRLAKAVGLGAGLNDDLAARRVLDARSLAPLFDVLPDPWRSFGTLQMGRWLLEASDVDRVDDAVPALLAARKDERPLEAANITALAALWAWQRGEARPAEDAWLEVLNPAIERGWPLLAVDALEGLAVALAFRGRESDGARLAGAARAERGRLGYRFVWPLMRAALDAAARRDPAVWAAGEEAGAELDLARAAAYAQRMRGKRGRPDRGWDSLTSVELDVARAAAEGLTNAAIGRRLLMSPATVKTHLGRVYVKLGVANRTALTAELTGAGDAIAERA